MVLEILGKNTEAGAPHEERRRPEDRVCASRTPLCGTRTVRTERLGVGALKRPTPRPGAPGRGPGVLVRSGALARSRASASAAPSRVIRRRTSRGTTSCAAGAVLDEPVLQSPAAALVGQRRVGGESREVRFDVVAATMRALHRAGERAPAAISDQPRVDAARELEPPLRRLRRWRLLLDRHPGAGVPLVASSSNRLAAATAEDGRCGVSRQSRAAAGSSSGSSRRASSSRIRPHTSSPACAAAVSRSASCGHAASVSNRGPALPRALRHRTA